jgi:hypothetical protein
MDLIDKITLEFLMNKNTYSRYIEKTDPKKFKEEQEFRKKINKYKSRMLSFTIKYLDDPNMQVNNELDTMLCDYTKTFIKYFEINDLEVSCFYNETPKQEEDIMFGNMDCENEFIENDTSSVQVDDGSVDVSSENANKLLCRYTMDRYVKKI